ncbi:MAG: hypothetical protein R3F34_05965 [Planctomycetota bacterium]
MRVVLRLVGLLFVLVGTFVAWVGSSDPAPIAGTVTHRAPVATIEFGASAKMGRYVTVRLAGLDERFTTYYLGKVDGLEERLASRVTPGTEVALTSVERTPGAFGHDETIPMPIHALAIGDEVLLDRSMFSSRVGDILATAAPIGGGLFALLGLALLGLSFKSVAQKG